MASHQPPTSDDFVRRAAPIRLGCDQALVPLTIEAIKIVDPPEGSQFAVGLGLVHHASHDHLLVVQLERSSDGDWQLHSDAHTEAHHGQTEAFVVNDMRSCGTLSVGARIASSAHKLRLIVGSMREETEFVGGIALLATGVTAGAGSATVEVLDVDGRVLDVRPVGSGGLSDLGVSYRR